MQTLAEYNRKRSFKKTSEPKGKLASHKNKELIFVVQKHAASHLHYDFRLEWNGVLKSWAIPKGPSLDPKVKRFAAHVEDHPYDYKDFEGIIPKGQYGAGVVKIWDKGTWIPEGDPQKAYLSGKIHFQLKGKKLKGEWILLRMGGKTEGNKNWLLMKGKDARAFSERAEVDVSSKIKAPAFLPPQLATLVDEVPSGNQWLHEIKFDGYRAITRIEKGKVTIFTRNQKDWTHRFPEIAKAMKTLSARQALIDGEIVQLSEKGISSFQSLQNALSDKKTQNLYYYLFDLLFLDGEDLTQLPLEKRRELLYTLLKASKIDSHLKFSESIQGSAKKFYREACKMGLEGVLSKRKDLPYESGRSRSWLKTKCSHRQEFVICGFTAPQGKRDYFGALVLGVYEGKKLRYAGLVGTGFTQTTLKELHTKLSVLKTDTPAFKIPSVAKPRKITWVTPKLIGEVEFSEWTNDKLLRHPSFQGLREDKDSHEVIPEKPSEINPKTPLKFHFSHPDKVLYAKQGITKQMLGDYYERVADYILPHLKDRPLSLVRCPQGSQNQCFYQKHVAENMLGSLKTVQIKSKEGVGAYAIANDVSGLLSLVQMSVLEIHPWGSRYQDLEHPDRIIFDLDPDEGIPWKKVIDATKLLHALLDELGLKSFLKTTGGKGLHVVVPFQKEEAWPEVKAFSKSVVELMAKDSPKEFTLEIYKAKRHGKIFLDYLRNDRGATAVAPYSSRAKEKPTVSVPLFWDELSVKLKSDQFTIQNLPKRLDTLKEDPWKDFFKVKQSLNIRKILDWTN